MGIKQTLVNFMKEPAYSPMTLEELVAIFDIRPNEIKAFQKTLRMMEREGLINRTKKEKYRIAGSEEEEQKSYGNDVVIGTLEVHQRGFGFLIPDEEGVKDIFLPSNAMSDAMNGDKVAVKVTREDKDGKKREGIVVDIVERNLKTVIGVYQDSKNFGFVISEDTRISKDIYIPKRERNGASDGDVVIVKITKYSEKGRKPEGAVCEILGKKGDRGVDILTIIKKNELALDFPQKVLKYAEGISDVITEEDLKGRRDLRGLKMVTIDGEDAKDLDDAVSVEKLDNGNYRLGVHIADVTNYVRENNPLDKEAFKRGTSVYLIDRVIPMLPKKLSNGICSLNPQVDRLALTCFMEINSVGKVVNHELTESVIKTNERMTYTDVTKILVDKDEELRKRYDYLIEDFENMEALFKILRKKRDVRGAIDFEIAEAKIVLNELGKPIKIEPYDRGVSNRIIEEFMLAANETVAEHMFRTHLPFVYRIHETPDEEKLEKFKEFVYNLGYTMNWSDNINPKMFQGILQKVKGKNEETVVSTLLLRSMMQAKYSPDCAGHFGLAAEYYCHFTSPIRRYPDLQIHRIIKEYLHGEMTEKRVNKLKNIVGEASKRSSEMERKAQDAEREVDDLKKAEYMMDRIGEEYDGIISSVTSFGLFVELANTVEGLVHITTLDDDYYVFDEQHLSLVGERTKKIYKLGDRVRISCERVDIDNKEIFFTMLANKTEEDKKID